MNLIAWLVIGGLAGWIASKIMNRDAEMGILKNIIVGIIGSFVGGFVLNFFTHGDVVRAFDFRTLLTSILGACIFLWILNLIQGRK